MKGTPFVIKTDQKNLKYLLDQRVLSIIYQKDVKLLGLNYNIQYKPESSNSAVDVISRREQMNTATEVLYTVTTSTPAWIFEVINSYCLRNFWSIMRASLHLVLKWEQAFV